MWFKRKTRGSDVSNRESVAGRQVATFRHNDGFTYCQADGQVMLKALKIKGFEPCGEPGASPGVPTIPEVAALPNFARVSEVLATMEVGTIVQRVRAGRYDIWLDTMIEVELDGENRTELIDAFYARHNVLVDQRG